MPLNVVMPADMQWFGPGYRLRILSGVTSSPSDWAWIISCTGPGGALLDYNATYRPLVGADWPSPLIGTAAQLDVEFALYPALFIGAHPAAGPGDTCQLGVTYTDSAGNFFNTFRNFKLDNIGGFVRFLWKFPGGGASAASNADILNAVRQNYHNTA